jgi:hypothetical protein
MSGLILLAVVIPLVWGLVWLARSIASKAEKPLTRAAIKWSVLLVLLTLPFIDEIIGKFQFEALCRANGIESADVSRARGKKVKLEIGERRLLEGTVMPIKVEDWTYRDPDTGEILIQHKDYFALGGWLMRFTPLSMGSPQSMFPGNGCGFVVWQNLLDAAQISVIAKQGELR